MGIQVGLIVGAYLYASLPFVRLAAGLKGIALEDIRRHGSRNVGGSNIGEMAGVETGILAGILDLSKGALPIVIGYYALHVDLVTLCMAGIASVVGQMWPVFERFFGGRGGASSGGVLLGLVLVTLLTPRIVVIVVPFAVGFAMKKVRRREGPSRSVPLGMLLTFILAPLASWVWQQPCAIILTSVGILLLLILRRLTADLSSDLRGVLSARQVAGILLNRLLYDRSYVEGYRRPADAGN